MKRNQPLYKALLFWTLLILISNFQIGADESSPINKAKQVLIIHSAYQGYPWTDSLNVGIHEVFDSQLLSVDLMFEYIDTKRNRELSYLEKLQDLWNTKYKKQNIDLVLVCDNQAFDFVVQDRSGIFQDIPVVFAAYIGFTPEILIDKQPITGVIQETDIIETIKSALIFHPQTEKVVFVAPGAPPFRMVWLEGLDEEFSERVQIIKITENNMSRIDKQIESLGENIVVIPLNSVLGEDGVYIPFQQFVSHLSRKRPYPVYALWDIALGQGVVGGKMVSGKSQGKKAADLAVQILNGTPAADVPVVLKSPNQYMFDWDVLQKFNIKENELPKGSIVINQPQSFYSENKTIVHISLFIFLILLVLIVALIISVLHQRRTQQYLEKSDKTLQRSEAQFKELIQKSPLPMVIINQDQSINFFNDKFTELFGYTTNDIISAEEWWSHAYPDEKYRAIVQDSWTVAIEEARINGTDIEVQEWDLTIKDGTQRRCNFYMVPLEGISLSIINDISEARRTEKKLRESEEHFRLLSDDLPVIYCEYLPDSTLSYCNKAYTDFFESTENNKQSSFGNKLFDKLPKKEIDKLKTAFTSMTVENPIKRETLELVKKQEQYWLEWFNRGLFNDEGVIIKINSIGIDITKRKKDDAERERLMVAIEQAGDAIVITDNKGDILYINPIFEKNTGYKREEIIGENPRILKSGHHDPSFYIDMWKTLNAGEVWSGQITNKRKDGSLFTETATISPVLDDTDSIINFVAVKRDITGKLELEAQYQQSQKMESVGRLAGGIAHDFNNMLGVIIGFTQLAEKKVGDNDKILYDLGQILDAANRSKDITQQLLAFARKQVIAPQILDLNENIDGMLNMLTRLIGEELKLDWLPSKENWPVKIDPSQLNQILVNLCVNAADAIQGVGEITIRTAIKTLDSSFDNCKKIPVADYVVLSISDTGSGMDKDTIEKIFEPFFTTKPLNKGTGLGLASVYGIVKQNSGFINVESELTEGTTIEIFLPRQGSDSSSREKDEKEDIKLGRGETVLIVEDEATILELCTNMLEGLGYSILSANTIEDALKIAKEHSNEIKLLLSDVIMPEMNGRDLSEHLKKLIPDIKILMMSGYTSDIILEKGIVDEGINFLQKPFLLKDLALKVRLLLDQ